MVCTPLIANLQSKGVKGVHGLYFEDEDCSKRGLFCSKKYQPECPF